MNTPENHPPQAARLMAVVEGYLAAHPTAALLEEGRVAFDLRRARCALSVTHGRCLLEMWSEERNLVRTVVDVQERAHCLRIVARRMGAAKPQTLELVPTSDRRTPTTRDKARCNYQRQLERALGRSFPGAKLDGFRSAMDLEHSFGPAYARGRLLRGSSVDAVIGVGAGESPTAIDGVLTLAILWLDHCRQYADARRHFGGVKIVVPAGAWKTTAERMAWLNHAAAGFELYTLDERTEELAPVDWRDTGNLESRLTHAFSHAAARERCRFGVAKILSLLPTGAKACIEIHPYSPSEVGLSLHGLEFARVRRTADAASFLTVEEILFGAGPNETALTEDNETGFAAMARELFHSRRPDGDYNNALFRMQPERWLESVLRRHMNKALPGLRQDQIYSQVPAISSGERGLLDLLTLDRAGRLTVIEVKANEDLHLPLQALDYWIRVRALNADRRLEGGRELSAFARAGYFAGAEISPLEPRLLLAAPALRIHPANQTVLRYFSPKIEWELIALSEEWRRELKIVFRKRTESL